MLKSFFNKSGAKVKNIFVRASSKVKVNVTAIRKLYENRRAATNPLHEITASDAGTDQRAQLWRDYGEILKNDIHILTELNCAATLFTKEERKIATEAANLILIHLETCFKDAAARRNPAFSMKELEEKAQETLRAEMAGKPSTLG